MVGLTSNTKRSLSAHTLENQSRQPVDLGRYSAQVTPVKTPADQPDDLDDMLKEWLDNWDELSSQIGWRSLVTDPKLQLYSTAIFASRRPEHASIHGHRVSVLDRCQHDDGTWAYVVTPETKTDVTFTCAESELEVAEPRNDFADMRPFAVIRRMLSQYLHQDFDLQFDSIEDAIAAAVGDADIVELTATLSALETESDTVVEDVLNDHAVYLWDTWTPREFLAIIRSLAIARQSAIQNADGPRDAG